MRWFISVFGPISSIFDFITFFVMLTLLHASDNEFRSGWFVESLATQTLVVFLIRTRRVPFIRSRPGTFFLILTGMVAMYLVLVELAKIRFYAAVPRPRRPSFTREERHERHVARRAARFTRHAAVRPRNHSWSRQRPRRAPVVS